MVKYSYKYLEDLWTHRYWKFICDNEDWHTLNLLTLMWWDKDDFRHPLNFDGTSKYEIKWNWFYLSGNQNITWEIIQNNSNKPWSWSGISNNPNITWEIIQNNPDKDWKDLISEHPNIT